MRTGLALLAGISLGVGMMYLLDPERGRRRRALIRDQFASAVDTAQDQMNKRSLDMSNRAQGLVHEAKNILKSEPVSDAVLVERVRAAMGPVVSHPSSIEVSAHDGRVTLRGVILASEVKNLIDRVRNVAGVRAVENYLEVHSEPGNVPGLQGQAREQKQALS